MDAAYIRVNPGATTPIQIFDNSTIFVESITSGSGTWIGLSPEGELVSLEFDSNNDYPGLVLYGEGWIGSWIAGPDGLELIELCVPPYQEGNDIENVPVTHEPLPIAFQALYLSFVDIVETLELSPSEPIVLNDGSLSIVEFLAKNVSPEMSIVEITLSGENKKVLNQESVAAYCVREGSGEFIIWENGEPVTHEVKKGSVVVIPAGTPYQDSGEMTMTCVNRPAFNPDQVEILS